MTYLQRQKIYEIQLNFDFSSIRYWRQNGKLNFFKLFQNVSLCIYWGGMNLRHCRVSHVQPRVIKFIRCTKMYYCGEVAELHDFGFLTFSRVKKGGFIDYRAELNALPLAF